MPPREHEAAIACETHGIAFRLIDRSGDILPPTLRFNHSNQCRPDEERVVGYTVLSRPFGYGHAPSLCRLYAGAIAQPPGVCLPSTVPQLLVDKGSGFCLVKVDLGGGLFSERDEFHESRRRRGLGFGLEGGKLGSDRRLLRLNFLRELLPDRSFFGLAARPFLGSLASPCFFLCLALGGSHRIFALGHPLAQNADLFAQGGRSVDRLPRRHEGARMEIRRSAVGAVEPDAERSGELQRRQRVRMFAPSLMNGCVSSLTQRVEDVCDLLGDDPVIG